MQMFNNRLNNVSQRPGIYDKHQRSNYPQSTQNHKNRKMFIPIHKHAEYSNFIEPKLKKILNSSSGHEIIDIISSFKSISSSSNGKYSNQNNNNRISDTRDKFSSYNQNNHNSQQFQVLIRLYKHQIVQIFKKTAYVILNTPKLQCQSISLLQSGQSSSLQLNKPQIIYLLSLMSCFLIHPSNAIHNNHNINTFSHIFQYEQYKTQTIIEYILNHFQNNRNYRYQIRRQCFKHYKTVEDLIKYKQQYQQCYLSKYFIANDQQSIENYYQDIKVDFANKKIGGGALTKGCVQQQIMFANHPQMYILTLLCEPLKDQQAIISIGFNKYFKNTGYSYQTKYAGHQKANLNSQLPEVIVSIDAEEYQNREREQYRKQRIDREIIKAYTGFNNVNNVKQRQNVITGNWGCGAFKGDAMLKFIIQYIACSLAKKNMIYCPYGMENIFTKYILLLDKLRAQKSILQLYQLVVKSCQYVKSHHDNLFEQIQKGLGYGKNNHNNHNNNHNNHFNNNHNNHRQNNIYTQPRRDPYNSSNRPSSSHKYSKNGYDQRQSFHNNNNTNNRNNHHQSLNKPYSNNRQTQYKSSYLNNLNNNNNGILKSRIF